MTESINWQEKYEILVDYIRRERDHNDEKAMLSFRAWQYDRSNLGCEDFVHFECLVRQLDCVLSFADCILEEEDDE